MTQDDSKTRYKKHKKEKGRMSQGIYVQTLSTTIELVYWKDTRKDKFNSKFKEYIIKMLTEKYDKLVTESLTPRQQMNSTSLPTKGHQLKILKHRSKKTWCRKVLWTHKQLWFLKEDLINTGKSMKWNIILNQSTLATQLLRSYRN